MDQSDEKKRREALLKYAERVRNEGPERDFWLWYGFEKLREHWETNNKRHLMMLVACFMKAAGVGWFRVKAATALPDPVIEEMRASYNKMLLQMVLKKTQRAKDLGEWSDKRQQRRLDIVQAVREYVEKEGT